MNAKTFLIEIDQPDIPAISWLEEASCLPRSALKQAMHKGAVWLERKHKTHRLRRVKKVLLPADKLFLYYDEAILAQRPPPATLIHDATDWSVWYKPKVMFSQGTKWGDHCCLYRVAETTLDRITYPIHRLDRATSGLMVFAHSKSAAKHLIAQFENRTVKKIYRARVDGDATYLTKEKSGIIDTPIDGKQAKTHIVQACHSGDITQLTLQILTGRQHQIRRHLAERGFPIIGDNLYGEKIAIQDQTQPLALEAIELHFTCPSTLAEKRFNVDL